MKDYRIDRTFVADGERWVIDFKSSRHEGGDLEKFIAEECALYAEQLEGYREVMTIYDPAHAVRTALYFCRYQRLEEMQ